MTCLFSSAPATVDSKVKAGTRRHQGSTCRGGEGKMYVILRDPSPSAARCTTSVRLIVSSLQSAALVHPEYPSVRLSICPSSNTASQPASQPGTGLPDNTTSLMSKTTKSVKKGGGHEWQAVFREIARSCSTINNNRYALQSGRRVTRTGGRKREITYDRFLTE